MIMSVYDTMDLMLWEAKNKMSCIYCKEYKGLQEPCNKGITVQTLSESINCEYYQYNGEVKKQ